MCVHFLFIIKQKIFNLYCFLFVLFFFSRNICSLDCSRTSVHFETNTILLNEQLSFTFQESVVSTSCSCSHNREDVNLTFLSQQIETTRHVLLRSSENMIIRI